MEAQYPPPPRKDGNDFFAYAFWMGVVLVIFGYAIYKCAESYYLNQ